MFEQLVMSVNSKLKKISANLDTYEGKFNEISTEFDNTNTAIETVGTSVANVQSTSDDIKSLISNEVQTAIANMRNDILSAISSGSNACVKSVQRGTVQFSDKNNKTIGINSINPDKSFVIIKSENEAGFNQIAKGGSSTAYHYEPANCSVCISLTSTSIVLTPSYFTYKYDKSSGNGQYVFDFYGTVSYQVIEFY